MSTITAAASVTERKSVEQVGADVTLVTGSGDDSTDNDGFRMMGCGESPW